MRIEAIAALRRLESNATQDAPANAGRQSFSAEPEPCDRLRWQALLGVDRHHAVVADGTTGVG